MFVFACISDIPIKKLLIKLWMNTFQLDVSRLVDVSRVLSFYFFIYYFYLF